MPYTTFPRLISSLYKLLLTGFFLSCLYIILQIVQIEYLYFCCLAQTIKHFTVSYKVSTLLTSDKWPSFFHTAFQVYTCKDNEIGGCIKFHAIKFTSIKNLQILKHNDVNCKLLKKVECLQCNIMNKRCNSTSDHLMMRIFRKLSQRKNLN